MVQFEWVSLKNNNVLLFEAAKKRNKLAELRGQPAHLIGR